MSKTNFLRNNKVFSTQTVFNNLRTFFKIYTVFNISFLNIWLALNGAVEKHDELFHEEIHPSSSSGCRNVRGAT
jgi:flagellar biosynthesis protein FlhB